MGKIKAGVVVVTEFADLMTTGSKDILITLIGVRQ